MAKLWQFLQGHAKPAFSVKVQRGDQGKFFKNRSKSKPRLKGRKALLRKWYYPLIILHLRPKTGEDFRANSGFKSARMAKLWQFSQGHQKPAFSKNVQRGDQEKFSKNCPKGCPRWKRPKALWRKWHYPLISMHLNSKDWKRFRRKQWLQRCPNGQVMAIFRRSPKTRMFGKKAKGRPRETFKKLPKKYPSLQRAKSTLAKMSLSSNLYPLILQRLDKTLAHKAALRVLEWPSYGNFCNVTQNPHFL